MSCHYNTVLSTKIIRFLSGIQYHNLMFLGTFNIGDHLPSTFSIFAVLLPKYVSVAIYFFKVLFRYISLHGLVAICVCRRLLELTVSVTFTISMLLIMFPDTDTCQTIEQTCGYMCMQTPFGAHCVCHVDHFNASYNVSRHRYLPDNITDLWLYVYMQTPYFGAHCVCHVNHFNASYNVSRHRFMPDNRTDLWLYVYADTFWSSLCLSRLPFQCFL